MRLTSQYQYLVFLCLNTTYSYLGLYNLEEYGSRMTFFDIAPTSSKVVQMQETLVDDQVIANIMVNSSQIIAVQTAGIVGLTISSIKLLPNTLSAEYLYQNYLLSVTQTTLPNQQIISMISQNTQATLFTQSFDRVCSYRAHAVGNVFTTYAVATQNN